MTKGDKEKDSSFWADGYFAETMSSGEMKKRMRTLHMKNNEEMNFTCLKCNKKISAHNKDWHAGMCDECFDREHFRD